MNLDGSRKFWILCGNVLDQLAQVPDRSVQCVVTSPPYYGLRDYGTPHVVVGGDRSCGHQWGAEGRSGYRNRHGVDNGIHRGRDNRKLADNVTLHPSLGSFCQTCGAWKGSLGMEPTPEMYVQNMVSVFREVCRVLRDDGVLWLNIGDSYAGSGKGAWDNKNGGQKEVYIPPSDAPQTKMPKTWDGIKAKDLIGIPWMLAFALRADGWYLRQDIIWSKPNPMPEPTRDRCTKAHEYVFLFSKSSSYFWDGEAMKEPAVCDAVRGPAEHPDTKSTNGNGGLSKREPTGFRNRRSVWTVATKPFADAHFATFPPDLIIPCIRAGSQRGDIVLDPFSGSGTTGMVARKYLRRYIGIELNPDYVAMSIDRITDGRL